MRALQDTRNFTVSQRDGRELSRHGVVPVL